MIIKKDTILAINHKRKGKFFGIATRDFDPEKTEFYPIRVAQLKPVNGLNTRWEALEEIPCRKSLCVFKKV